LSRWGDLLYLHIWLFGRCEKESETSLPFVLGEPAEAEAKNPSPQIPDTLAEEPETDVI
jgi:hypothetical protein